MRSLSCYVLVFRSRIKWDVVIIIFKFNNFWFGFVECFNNIVFGDISFCFDEVIDNNEVSLYSIN